MFSRNIDVQIIDNDIPESLSQSETVLQQENTLQISKQAEESRSDLVEKTNTLSAIQIHNIIVNYCNNEHYHVNREILVSREPNRRHKRYPEIFLFNYETCPVYTIQKNSISLTEKKKDCFWSSLDEKIYHVLPVLLLLTMLLNLICMVKKAVYLLVAAPLKIETIYLA